MAKRILALILLLSMFFALFGISALADGWTCPNCGRENTDAMNFCGGCRTEKPLPDYSELSDKINGWVCSKCNNICPDADSFCTRCGTEHFSTDAKAISVDAPVFEEIQFPPLNVKRIPFSFNSDFVFLEYTAPAGGMYIFWIEDQAKNLEAKMYLYDSDNQVLRSNSFYVDQPGFAWRLTKNKTYKIALKGGCGDNPNITLCIGEARGPESVNARCYIKDAVDYYDQENIYKYVPEVTGRHMVSVTELQNGQAIDIVVLDEFNNVIKESYYGLTMGNGLSFDLQEGKPYYIFVKQRTGYDGKDRGKYKLLLCSPNPTISVSGCEAVGDQVYYTDQKNIYEYVTPETGEYSFTFAFTDASCRFKISIHDDLGYEVNMRQDSTGFIAELNAGQKYTVVVTQYEGAGSYSLFIKYICKHEHVSVINNRPATNTEKGYTGDTFCEDCQTIIQQGEEIPILEATEATERQIVFFGHYPQTLSGNDQTPIEWEILSMENGRALLISKNILDIKPYYTGSGPASWENGSLREWLNNDFLHAAFTDAEQQAIIYTSVDNSSIQGNTWDVRDEPETQDKVFLLSFYEAESKYMSNDADRLCAPTDYALALTQGINMDIENSRYRAYGRRTYSWWLRSAGRAHGAGCVYIDGATHYDDAADELLGLRPVMWVDVQNGVFQSENP